MKAYKINYHSIIDVITNSSSELFISTDGKIIDFIKSVLPENELKNPENNFSIQKFKDFYKYKDLDELKNYNITRYNELYCDLKHEDDILVCKYDTDEMEEVVSSFLDKLGFKSIYN